MPIRRRINTTVVTKPQAYERDATFSEDKVYRYTLWRRWAEGPMLVFIMLNPSTADAFKNDPTVGRCEKRAMSLGFGGFFVLNLFGLRSTRPEGLKETMDPVGPKNDYHIRGILIKAKAEGWTVVAAWGSHGRFMDRAKIVAGYARELGVQLHAIGLTDDHQPRHPLYLKDDAQLTPWPKMLRLKKCPA